MKSHVYLIAADPFEPRVLFAATTMGLLATTDAGAHWRSADRGLCGSHVHSLVIDAGPPALVFACTDEGVFRTADRGESWEKVSAAQH